MQICQSRTCYTILTDRKDKNHLFGKLNHLICSEPCIDSCFRTTNCNLLTERQRLLAFLSPSLLPPAATLPAPSLPA